MSLFLNPGSALAGSPFSASQSEELRIGTTIARAISRYYANQMGHFGPESGVSQAQDAAGVQNLHTSLEADARIFAAESYLGTLPVLQASLPMPSYCVA